MTADFLSGESLYRDVITYFQFGAHRTATEGETITTAWIEEELQAAGLKASSQAFPVRQFFLRESSLVVAGERIQCFPWWYPFATGPRPINARIAPLGANQKGKIALVKHISESGRAAYSYSEGWGLIQSAIDAGAPAVIIIADNRAGEIVAYYSQNRPDPWPVPVILVGVRDESILTSAVVQGAEVSLLVDGREEQKAEARNVFGTWESGENTIVISTPKSGWFRCAGERGPGVALFLALARWVGQRKPETSYLFDCNTGHELMGLGILRFIDELAPPPQRVLCWMHLGANIATCSWEETPEGLQPSAKAENYRIMCTRDDLLGPLGKAFASIPGVRPVVGQTIGEMAAMERAGYRGFGVNGGLHPFFHTPGDSPKTTAPELLEPIALSLTRALELIEAGANDLTRHK